MAERLPRITAAQALRAYARGGWYVSRQTGSHVVMRHSERAGRAVIPRHRGTLRVGTLAAILSQSGVSAEEFQKWLRGATR